MTELTNAPQDDFQTPPGYVNVLIEPSRTGLNYPLYMKVEERVEDKPALSQEGVFVPRNEIEATNVLNYVNKFRTKENMNPVSMNVYNANQDKFMQYAIGQYRATEEGKKSDDPYAYFVNNLQSYMDEGKKNNPLDQFSGFDAIQRPNEYALAQYFNIGEFISDFLPKGQADFMLGGELLGSLPAMALEASKSLPGAAKVPSSLFSKVMSSGGGVVAGAGLGRGLAGASYDFINDLIRLTAGIEKPTDTEDPGMRALVEMRNSAAFTTMAAGLGPLASYLRPVLGKVLGLGDDAGGMSKLADRYGIPIGISIAATGDMAGNAVKGFGKIIGVFPLVGSIMKDRQLRAQIATKKAIQEQIGKIGSAEDFYRLQYKLLTKEEKAEELKYLKSIGHNNIDEAIEAQIRLDAYAPIQHMTDVGMLMTKTAQDRYKRFSYVNNLLYESFENTAKNIKTPFIGTSHTKEVGKMLKERIDQYKIQLDDYDTYNPQMNEMEEFIVNTLGRLPEYIDPLQIRGLQKEINRIYGNMRGEFGANFVGADILAQARKALTTDLNNFAGWKQGLQAGQKETAEVAKRALLRANSVFARLSPIYGGQAAKKFKLIDENMFSAGPELPGWNYSDELYNIVMSKKITPQAIEQVQELIGKEAFESVTRTWLNEGFKQSLRRNNPIDLMVDSAPTARGPRPKRIMVTDFAVDPDALLQNIGFGEPGFEAMISASGLNGKVVKENILQLVDIARKIEGQQMGDPFALVKRRIALGGIRTGFKTFSFGAAAGVGGGAAVFGAAPVVAGLLARYTADFLSSPNVLKNYSRVIDDTTPLTVKRAAYTNIIRDFYKQISKGDRLEEFPDEFKTYEGVIKNPGGFSDWLFGAGFESSMSGVGNEGAAKAYNNKRYGNSDEGLNLSSYVTSDVEQNDMDKIVSSSEVKDQPTINIPEVPSMGTESVMPEIAQAAVPSAPSPLNTEQRAALASDDIDAAIALGQG